MIEHQDSKDLAIQITKISENAEPIQISLKTDEKVIARITDGIYREPASALRELISNAYDADATSVSIDTDWPRFERINIRDNGIGMNENSLANMILHIGGSAKRDKLGTEIGVTNPNDPTKSISGRRIIGKIGIGLFSVAQLTQQFQIITKVKGTNFRLIADVTLKTYSEDEISQDVKRFESGTVSIRKIKATDIDAHGTDICLFNLRKNAISILRSDEKWSRVEAETDEKKRKRYEPTFHIGKYTATDSNSSFNQIFSPSLPWVEKTPSDQKFYKIYESILNEVDKSVATPKIDSSFDYYFEMIWKLSLSSPIKYIEKHPFHLSSTVDEPLYFEISNDISGQALELNLDNINYQKFKNSFSPLEDPLGGFKVYIDGIELFRPLAFNNQKKSKNALQTPLMFYGKYKVDFGGKPKSITGGDLEFEAYFYWNSKIVPLDHNGIAVRISDTSGMLFDSKWMEYPVAERTTLSQISAEVFIINGLDAALNIDRESFNYAHPHYQILSRWVHNALRQITQKQKKLRSEKNVHRKIQEENIKISNLYKLPISHEILSSTDELVEFDLYKEKIEILNSAKPLQLEKLKLIIGLLQYNGLLDNLNDSELVELIENLAGLLLFGE